jgi:hypothetical protein
MQGDKKSNKGEPAPFDKFRELAQRVVSADMKKVRKAQKRKGRKR